MSDDLLDVKQVQERLRVSERTVFNLIKRGDLNGFKAGREWRFTIEDIREYENRQRQRADEQRNQKKKEAA